MKPSEAKIKIRVWDKYVCLEQTQYNVYEMLRKVDANTNINAININDVGIYDSILLAL